MFLTTLLCLALGFGLGWYQLKQSPYLQHAGEGQLASTASEEDFSLASRELREQAAFRPVVGRRLAAGDSLRARVINYRAQ
jgi:hypothetical protein